jgi:hypothetical protein
MKKLLLLLVFALFSCTNENCDDKIAEITKQYQEALWRAGSSTAAILKVQSDYNRKLNEIYSNCN